MKLRLPLLAIVLLAAYAAWARGGTPAVLQWPLPLIGGVILITLPQVAGGYRAGWALLLRRAVRDPLCWAGALFLGLLCVQWGNAGRFHYFDPFKENWGYTAAAVPWLTSAVTRAEAAEMLRWFVPAWILVVALRAGGLGRSSLRFVLAALAVNGAALSLFGIVQQLSGTTAIFWMTELDGTRFFASFGYENHAGSYFVLMSAIAIGFLLDEVFRYARAPRIRILTGWGLIALLNFVGANLSFSRAGILLAWVLAAFALVYLLRKGRSRWRPSTFINVLLAALLVAAVGAMTIEQIAGKTVTREMASLKKVIDPTAPISEHPTLLLGDRVVMIEAACEIWRDYPWFGCGGWGYRYLMPYQLPEDNWQWSSRSVGKANVHNDPMQFVAEFGAVGAGLMLGIVLGLALPALRSRDKRPLTVLALVGTALVAIHSLVDLPFRSPAILFAWILALGCVSGMERERRNDE